MIEFDISYRNLTSLDGVIFPENVQRLYCHNNQLTSLEGCPPSVLFLDCSNNQLISLKGCSPSVQLLDCENNHLTNLKGCPPSVPKLWINYNQLTSLEDCPPSVEYLWCYNNPLDTEYRNKSMQEIHTINRIKAYRKGILKLNSIIFPTLIQRCFRYHYYDKLNSDGVSLFCLRSMEEDKKSGILI